MNTSLQCLCLTWHWFQDYFYWSKLLRIALASKRRDIKPLISVPLLWQIYSEFWQWVEWPLFYAFFRNHLWPLEPSLPLYHFGFIFFPFLDDSSAAKTNPKDEIEMSFWKYLDIPISSLGFPPVVFYSSASSGWTPDDAELRAPSGSTEWKKICFWVYKPCPWIHFLCAHSSAVSTHRFVNIQHMGMKWRISTSYEA